MNNRSPSISGSLRSREELEKSVLDKAIDLKEQRRLDEVEINERQIRREADFERERAALIHSSLGNGQGNSPEAVIHQQEAIMEDCAGNAAFRIGDQATPGSTFAQQTGDPSYIQPFTTTTQPSPFPTVPTLGGQIPSTVASMIASRDNLGYVTSVFQPGKGRASLEDETRRIRAEQERKEYEMRCRFEAEKKKMEHQHRVELEKKERDLTANFNRLMPPPSS